MAMTTTARARRVAGLAVGLGVGAAVATGLAAAASAAPSAPVERSADPAVGAGSEQSGVPRTAAHRGSRAAQATPTARHGSGAAVSPAAAVANSATKPTLDVAAQATAAVAVRQNPRRASVEPAGILPAQTAVAPPATASNPISGFIDAIKQFFCDPRGRQITIYKRTHFAIPNSFGFFIREVSGTGTFTANSTYDLGDEDQWDWNKFTGIAFTPLEPDRNSVMVGWRYNLISKEFEIAPFYNVDKARILPTPQDIISIPADQTFQYNVDYTGVTLTYGDKTVFKAFPQGLTPNVWTAARVSGWFGGNEVAPRTISYFLKID